MLKIYYEDGSLALTVYDFYILAYNKKNSRRKCKSGFIVDECNNCDKPRFTHRSVSFWRESKSTNRIGNRIILHRFYIILDSPMDLYHFSVNHESNPESSRKSCDSDKFAFRYKRPHHI